MPPESNNPPIGQTVSHFKILEKIGQGGMGTVYKAQDLLLDRFTVLKFLLPYLGQNEEAKERFVREAKSASALDHQNVCTIYEIGEIESGQTFISMAYYEGETLKEQIADGVMPFANITDFAIQIARGLEAAHERGITHRDIKPANVIVTKEGVVKILDFGLAKLTAAPDLTSPGTILGSSVYMSPEQLSAEAVDARSDIWSLGVTLYEMTAGHRPFQAEYDQALIYEVLNEDPKPVSECRQDVPAYIGEAIEKALAKNPAERFQSAAAFAQALAGTGASSGASSSRSAPRRNQEPAHSSKVPESPRSDSPRLEVAHVLFTDIVGYSRLPMDEGAELVEDLTRIIESTDRYQQAKQEDQLILLPTGDGVALTFFGDAIGPIECAVEISRALKSQPELQLRMGIHSGPVFRTVDINRARNVAGGGINLAQRVMDSGDGGHILVSKTVADMLSQLRDWRGYLHELGEHTVKHGENIVLFNLYGDDFGKQEQPSKIAPPLPPSAEPTIASAPIGPAKTGPTTISPLKIIAATAAVALVLLLALNWKSLVCGLFPGSPPCAAAFSSQRTLLYWITVQRYRDGAPYRDPFQVAGEMIFESDFRIFLHLKSDQAGHLYIINEGPVPIDGLPSYNVLFPKSTINNGQALLQAGADIQLPERGGFAFDAEQGTEKLWCIWTEEAAAPLESVKGLANPQERGVIRDRQKKAAIQKFLAEHHADKPRTERLEEEKQTLITASSDVLVHLIRLEHQ
jgi:serine/threonine protein kinase